MIRTSSRLARKAAWLVRLTASLGLLVSTSALAQPTLPELELERLALDPAAVGSLLPATGDLLPEGRFRVALALHYENNPLVMLVDGERVGSLVRDRATAHLSAAWAPLRWLEIEAQVPLIFVQAGDDLSAHGAGQPAAAGLGTLSLGARVGLLSQRGGVPVDLALELGTGLPVGSAAALGRDPGFRLLPRVSVGRSFGPVRAGVRAGALVRTQSFTLGADQDTEMGSGLDLAAVVSTTGAGLRGELGVQSAIPFGREPGALELLGGVRFPFANELEIFAIGGLGLARAPGTPAFRALLGVSYGGAPRCVPGGDHAPADCPELDDDGDGMKNGQDACPREGGRVDARGCTLPDRDGDGLADNEDRCPKEAGPTTTQGCPDADKDGLADNEDQCPHEAGSAQTKGCPFPDADGDGVTDSLDLCPSKAGVAESMGCPDTDGDGVADDEDQCPRKAGPAKLQGCPDTDGDGVPDVVDNCPREAGVAENYGCSARQKQLVIIRKEKIEIKEKIFFDTNRARIKPKSFKLLNQVARVLVEHPEISMVSIEGHTDDKGNRNHNLRLSQARADAVMAYLVKKGVEPERLKAQGFGPDRPLMSNLTPDGREINRRVEFFILDSDSGRER